MKQYETIIGLEVHVELAAKTKIFCGCPTIFGAKPNTQTCPVCTGLPGTLPVLNKQVVEHAIAVGLAVNCDINRKTVFDRKNYFYPDNPQNYQISQLYRPICRNGGITIKTDGGEKLIRIHEIHMEEDAGKLIHDEENNCSYVDYNRAGVPLIEIVSEPDMRNDKEVIAYLDKLRLIIQYLEVSDCKLQEGSMRADVNISVRQLGSKELGVRTEMKNLNSFKAISRAIENERERQIALIEAGQAVTQETRRWDDNKGCSFSMRSKEDSKDYRYFPEPDLYAVNISEEWIEQIRVRQPELRDSKKKRYIEEYGLPEYDADIISSFKKMAQFFEETVSLCHKPKKVSNWLMVETMRLLNENGMEPDKLNFFPKHLARLIDIVDEGKINSSVAKEVFERIFYDNIDPERYIEEKGLIIDNDEDALKAVIRKVIEANPQSVEDYHNGKERAMGFLVGQIMKEMKGKANPKIVNVILKDFLG